MTERAPHAQPLSSVDAKQREIASQVLADTVGKLAFQHDLAGKDLEKRATDIGEALAKGMNRLNVTSETCNKR
ncbi:hypothetical protein GCM10010082_05810 [Kushneria pakistanensis]|uniref:Uncharacterized protein n=1 Tax=Kushneria pakistanensis TaxID=1508770 RepID=A0ABQ3FBN7_9GAMM|nr:hypothetical protein [Kushneria pakistanensis]GHC17465.1 hypothetical protein GCM10010082_05810 [Kushneria pakistanensis]